MPLPPLTPGRTILTLCAFLTSTGCFLADWSPSHLFNPRWPPHAKFHNAQTMSFGLFLGLLTAYYTWRVLPTNTANPPTTNSTIGYTTHQDTTRHKKEFKNSRDSDLYAAAIFGSLYYVAGLSAILYPGTKGTDPEFGEGFPQLWLFVVLGVLPWVGYWIG